MPGKKRISAITSGADLPEFGRVIPIPKVRHLSARSSDHEAGTTDKRFPFPPSRPPPAICTSRFSSPAWWLSSPPLCPPPPLPTSCPPTRSRASSPTSIRRVLRWPFTSPYVLSPLTPVTVSARRPMRVELSTAEELHRARCLMRVSKC